jgi:predicted nucleotide-binding protein
VTDGVPSTRDGESPRQALARIVNEANALARQRGALAVPAKANQLPRNGKVMVIYGHDTEAKADLFDWLREVGLQPQEWDDLVQATGEASPYTGVVLDRAFQDVEAVIAFFTPDERVCPRDHDRPWRFQARPNVLIEAGMALVTHSRRTVLVVLGSLELPSDLAGRDYVCLDDSSKKILDDRCARKPLEKLANYLIVAGCKVDRTGIDRWLSAGRRFPDRGNVSSNE